MGEELIAHYGTCVCCAVVFEPGIWREGGPLMLVESCEGLWSVS
jgi:hypothetical protein